MFGGDFRGREKADSAQAAMKENGLKWGLLPTPVDFFDETIDEKKFEEALEIQKRWAQLGEKNRREICL